MNSEREEQAKEFVEFTKKVTPEGLFNYYSSLSRAERKRIDKTANKIKRFKHKLGLRRYNETRFKPIIDEVTEQ